MWKKKNQKSPIKLVKTKRYSKYSELNNESSNNRYVSKPLD